MPSPKGIYDDVRCLERATLLDGSLAPLSDTGIEPSDLIPALSNEGVRAIRAPTSDGRYSDVEPANVNAGPSVDDDIDYETSAAMGRGGYRPAW